MPRLFYFLTLLLTTFPGGSHATETVELSVYPQYRRQIDGVCELDRTSLFALCDHGVGFDQRMRDPERVEYLLKDLNATFGRSLGPIRSVVRNEQIVREDPDRPGFADLELVKQESVSRQRPASKVLQDFVGERMDIAAHGSHNAYPEFMGAHTTPQSTQDPNHSQHLPENMEAAAELAAAVLQYNYGDFTRPRYFEPVNEPHWSFIGAEHLANWHLKTHSAVHDRGLDVEVGGPCNSVCYFYRNDFNAFNGVKNFINNTKGQLDFYSFHAYDYLNWNGQDLVGRISSGLPLEGMIDLVQNHLVNEFGEQKGIVISEHGGYVTGSQGRPTAEEVGDLLAAKYFPEGEGFEHEMRKRSIQSHVLVSAIMANTLTFMDHPHVIKKAVPFILPESMAWDPKYYSTLYVPYDFTDRSRWVETRNSDFYKFFRDVQGERVIIKGGDPDIQARAFADKDRLIIVVNNLSDELHDVKLDFPQPKESTEPQETKSKKIVLRRYGRNEDYTPYLTEENIESLEQLQLAGREAVLVAVEYDQEIPVKGTFNETPHYGSQLAVKATKEKPARFLVEIPAAKELAFATLRLSISRPFDADPNVLVKVNGKRVEFPLEDAVSRLAEEGREYASTKIVQLDRKLLREQNRVEVSFPDDRGGTVGSVVIRAGTKL
ncbi:MAG: beta-agarase [Lacipirellulaceae bacterium]